MRKKLKRTLKLEKSDSYISNVITSPNWSVIVETGQPRAFKDPYSQKAMIEAYTDHKIKIMPKKSNTQCRKIQRRMSASRMRVEALKDELQKTKIDTEKIDGIRKEIENINAKIK